jgi:DNA-binding response OmpR family regulator
MVPASERSSRDPESLLGASNPGTVDARLYHMDTRRTPKPNGSHRHRVLLGEDNLLLCGVLAEFLVAEGHEVTAAGSGTEFLDKLAVSLHPELGVLPFDLLICEEALLAEEEFRTFSRLLGWADVPPLMLFTVRVDDGVRAKAKQLGALVTWEKPVALENLRKVTRTVLGRIAPAWAGLETGAPS